MGPHVQSALDSEHETKKGISADNRGKIIISSFASYAQPCIGLSTGCSGAFIFFHILVSFTVPVERELRAWIRDVITSFRSSNEYEWEVYSGCNGYTTFSIVPFREFLELVDPMLESIIPSVVLIRIHKTPHSIREPKWLDEILTTILRGIRAMGRGGICKFGCFSKNKIWIRQY